ncbi:MAG: GxxExxY protein [Longimicrobiales bacterium]
MEVNEIVEVVMDCAFDVHRALGPGLYESAYKRCLIYEFEERQVEYEEERVVPLIYRGQRIGPGYRLDLLVEGKLVVEAKAVKSLTPRDTAQVLTYLRLGKYPVGLLFNFHSALLKDGMKRLVWDYDGPRPSDG